MRRRGAVLIIVLIVVLMLSLIAYSFSFMMRAEYRATKTFEETNQARHAALSGSERILFELDRPYSERVGLGEEFVSIPLDLSDTSIALNSGEVDHWRFAVISPMTSESTEQRIRGGWEDESAKLDLMTLMKWEQERPGHAAMVLSQLPGMDEDSLRRLLDVIAPGTQTEVDSGPGFGEANAGIDFSLTTSASQSSGSSLRDATNSLKPGVTPVGSADVGQALPTNLNETALNNTTTTSGASSSDPRMQLLAILEDRPDIDRNYTINGMELRAMGEGESGPANQTYSMATPESESRESWRDYVTVFSAERNEASDGTPRMNLNQDDLVELHQSLIARWPLEWANYVVLYRQFGPTGDAETNRTSASQVTIDLQKPASVSIETLLDLLDTKVSVELDGDKNSIVESPFQSSQASGEAVTRLFDEATTSPSKRLEGRINVMTAPAHVIASIPGVDQAFADQIVMAREGGDLGRSKHSLAWLLARDVCDVDTLRTLEPWITLRSDVVRAQLIGYRNEKYAMFRADMVLDGASRPGRVVYQNDLHTLGRGFTTDEIDALHLNTNRTKP